MANRKGGWKRADGKVDGFRPRREISYSAWGADDVEEFVSAWVPRNRGWFVFLSDSDLCGIYRETFERHGLTGFQPLPILIPGMTVQAEIKTGQRTVISYFLYPLMRGLDESFHEP